MGLRGPKARPVVDRFAEKIALTDSGCIEWISKTVSGGYGLLSTEPGHRHAKHLAHRWSYEYHVGPIPEGLHIDHLCRNRLCVNPEHLEPVTPAENVQRGARARTHCSGGHLIDDENSYFTPKGHRRCRLCARVFDDARRDKKNAQRREMRRQARQQKEAA